MWQKDGPRQKPDSLICHHGQLNVWDDILPRKSVRCGWSAGIAERCLKQSVDDGPYNILHIDPDLHTYIHLLHIYMHTCIYIYIYVCVTGQLSNVDLYVCVAYTNTLIRVSPRPWQPNLLSPAIGTFCHPYRCLAWEGICFKRKACMLTDVLDLLASQKLECIRTIEAAKLWSLFQGSLSISKLLGKPLDVRKQQL